MKNLITTLAALTAGFAVAACGGRQVPDKSAYFGTWEWADGGGMQRVTIGADTLRFWEGDAGGEHSLAALTWEPIDEPNGNADYPTGYIITGTLIAADNISLASADSPDDDDEAAVGGRVRRVWYIRTDGQSLAGGTWYAPHGVIHDALQFVKQPDATATVAAPHPAEPDAEEVEQEEWDAPVIPAEDKPVIFDYDKANAGKYHRITKEEIGKYVLERLPDKRDALFTDYAPMHPGDYFDYQEWYVTDSLDIVSGVKSLVIYEGGGNPSAAWLVNYNAESGEYIDSFSIYHYYESDFGDTTIEAAFYFDGNRYDVPSIDLLEHYWKTYRDSVTDEPMIQGTTTHLLVEVTETGKFRIASRHSKSTNPQTIEDMWKELEESDKNN